QAARCPALRCPARAVPCRTKRYLSLSHSDLSLSHTPAEPTVGPAQVGAAYLPVGPPRPQLLRTGTLDRPDLVVNPPTCRDSGTTAGPVVPPPFLPPPWR
ncbi:Anaphase-promoting complex subunit 5, partial [Frankliniella fusca]